MDQQQHALSQIHNFTAAASTPHSHRRHFVWFLQVKSDHIQLPHDCQTRLHQWQLNIIVETRPRTLNDADDALIRIALTDTVMLVRDA